VKADHPQAAVVFATHNRADRLAELLEGLRAQSVGTDAFEVVAVDDASGDATPQVLADAQDNGGLKLRALRLQPGRGPAAARNAGWRASDAPLVIFTDDDCVPSAAWVEAALRAHAEHPGAVIQGRTRPRPDELDDLSPFHRTLRVEHGSAFFETCNVAYPRELLERVDGFDEEAFTVPGGEDADLAHRVLDAGADAVFEPDALVYHAVSDLGPVGKLRVAWRWSETMRNFKRHPQMRRTGLFRRLFWKPPHYLLVRFLVGMAIRRRFPRLGDWLAWPYLGWLITRHHEEGGSGPWLAPYWLVHDLVELAAVLRGAVRYRVFIL
jgi:GT2 family glycosyltransferase